MNKLFIVLHGCFVQNCLNTNQIFSITTFFPGVCVTGDNEIYLAGGALRKLGHSRHDGNRVSIMPEGVSPNVFTLNIGLRTWDAKIRMNQQRCQFPLVVVDG
jgi:hypothetical protein